MQAVLFSNLIKIITKIAYQYKEGSIFCFCDNKVDCSYCKSKIFLEEKEIGCSLWEMNKFFVETDGLKMLTENY